MKTTAIGAVTLMVLGGLFAQKAASFSASGDTFTSQFAGEITDSFCAEDGRHIGVTKINKNTSKAGCVLTCVKLGGAEFVLYNPETKRTYKLDDQLQPEAFAGQKVIVAGTYDRETKTIRVAKIKPLVESAF